MVISSIVRLLDTGAGKRLNCPVTFDQMLNRARHFRVGMLFNSMVRPRLATHHPMRGKPDGQAFEKWHRAAD